MAGDPWHKAFGDYSNTSFAELLRRTSPDLLPAREPGVDGDVPGVGDEVEEGEERLSVTKVAPSPLPGDSRRCAYLQPLS